MHGEAREFLLGQLQPDRHGVERAPREDRLPEALDAPRRQQLQRDQPREGVLEVRDLLADELELVGRAVQRQRLAVAVEDQPARRRHRVDADPVALGQLAEVIVADDLQVEQPRAQHAEQQEDDERRRDDAAAEHALLGDVILEPGVACHGRRALSASGA